jgi:hypothetical protein
MISACSGRPPNTRTAARAMRTTPAVCELDGPIMMGPIMSNTLLFSGICGFNDEIKKGFNAFGYFLPGKRYF